MHIVVLTGYYFPNLSASAGCIKPYLLELAKEHTVEVVCPLSDNHNDVKVVSEGIAINFVNSLPNKLLSYIKTNQEKGQKPLWTKILFNFYRAMRYLKSCVSIKPYETSLINEYVKKLDEVNKQNSIDVVISVTFPFYTHVAALKFKEAHRQIMWITYTTDPLAYSESNPIPRWKLKTAISIEENVYMKCDKCIVTEALYRNVIEDFKIHPNKVLQLPFLMYDEAIEVENSYNERPVVVYAGFLFYGVRNPIVMLDVFSKLKEVDLKLYVSGDRLCRSLLYDKTYPDNITINGLVPSNEYKSLLGKADVLINLSNDAKLQAPHKLMELLSTGKPIINFYYHKDSGYSIIDKYPLGINVPNKLDDQDIANVISHFIKENSRKVISYDEIKSIYPEFLFKNQYPKFKDVINSFSS